MSIWKCFVKLNGISLVFKKNRKKVKKRKKWEDKLSKKAEGSKVTGIIFDSQLTNPSFPKILKGLYGDKVKFIFFLRNPAQRAFSLWKYMLREGLEWKWKFEDALAQESSRFYNPPEFIKERAELFWNYMYWRGGLYYLHLKKFYEIFGKDFMDHKAKIYLYEQILSNPQRVFKDICDFLDVKISNLEEVRPLPDRWENKIPFSPEIQLVFRIILDKLERSISTSFKFNSENIRIIFIAFMKINILCGRDLKTHWLIDFLQEAYKEDIANLSEITDKNFFNIWYGV